MIGDAHTGSDFGGLTRYLYTGHKGNNPGRVEWTEARNLPTDDPQLVPAMMRATAALSRRVQDPVFHYSISWPEYEQLPQEDMLRIADRTLSDLDLDEHQAIIVAHNDTDHPHVHVMVNRVHPETGVAWEKWKYKTRLERSLKDQEKELGLTQVPGRLSNEKELEKAPRRPAKGEQRMAERLDVSLLDHWGKEHVALLKDTLAPAFEKTTSWQGLEDEIKKTGVTLYAKGPGIILTNGEKYAKLSEMGKKVRKTELEERFGKSFSDYAEERQQKRLQPTNYWDMAQGLKDRVVRAGRTVRDWVFGRKLTMAEKLEIEGVKASKRRPRGRSGRDFER
ncbi:MAG: relaxase/mobilization nuclease domain-containing protein [Parvibaculaceae bacterium]|nr:relaxase/mobilization nuclease domain-containing protein [Parvibaculaceae bacterium]|tara:strand:- start:5523 stop:6530 length:1008 start_codon:yes stop_codon:yes gene_type:complete